LAEVPAAPAVFILRGEPGSEPYVGKSADLRRRLTRLLGTPEPGSKRLNLRERCRAIEHELSGSDFESAFLLYRVLRTEFPKSYRDRMKLRFAPLIKLNLENPFPRAYVTRRISKLNSASRYYGPFPSRAVAEKFLNDSLDFFKMRRCDFDLNPDPAFPGCMYSEMKMCLAPCFKGCTDEQYAAEVKRVHEFLESGGRSLLDELSAERERASADLRFEEAAAIHGRAEKVRGVLGAVTLPEMVHPIDFLNALVVQRSNGPNQVQLFKVAGGMVSAPHAFQVEQNLEASLGGPAREESGRRTPRSMESRIAEALEAVATPVAASATELNEHLALLKRWYYRTNRTGEIFFADATAELPMRRVVRGISRVFRGEKPEFEIPPPAI